MFKKILGLILCVATLASMVTTPAMAAKESTWKTDALRELGIYQENPVTYDGFIKSIAGFFYDNTDEIVSIEEFAKGLGMFEAGETYQGQSTLTVDEALKLSVIALGYKPIIGADGNYVKKASEIGIADGISAKGSAKLKADIAAEILYGMIEAEPVVRTYGGKDGATYEVAYDKTLLSINRDIYEIKGLLTGTEKTSIYGEESKAKEDYITINSVSYFVGNNNYDRLLGRNVIAYIQETDDLDATALYVEEVESKNESVIIDSEDITDIGESISDITYYITKNKTKKLNIVASPRVIYNGLFLKDYIEADFRDGMLELIDYDGNRKYDVIKITSYKTMVVESIDTRDKVIKNRYRFYGYLPEVRLDPQNGEDKKIRIFDGMGEEVDFSAIKVDDILSVVESRDKKLVDIYISGNDRITGTITGLNNADDLVYIDGQEFEKSNDFKKFLVDTKKSLKLRDIYNFYFDNFGKIAFIKEKKFNDYNVLIKIGLNKETDKYYAVHMDMDGDWYTSPIYEKVRINGEAISYYEKMEAMASEIKANPEIVLIKFNSRNEITDIQKATAYASTDEYKEKSTKSEAEFCSIAGDYNYLVNGFFQVKDNIEDIVYPENGAKVVVIPSKGTEHEENWNIYDVGSFFKPGDKAGQEYPIKYFSPDKFKFSNLFVINEDHVPANVGLSDALYVVTGFQEILVDGDTYRVIEGSVDGFMNLSFQISQKYEAEEAKKEEKDRLKLEVGDVINFKLDDEGRIDAIAYKGSLEDLSTITAKNIYAETALNAGSVEAIDYEAGRILMKSGTYIIPLRVNPTMQVTVYYGASDGCESKALSSINPQEEILIRTSYGKVDEIICVKN